MAEMRIDISEIVNRAVDKLIESGWRPTEWIPCREIMPDEEKEVLVYVKGDFDNSIPFITTAYINSDGDWQSDYDGEVIDSKITHWMPLPEPPESEVQSDAETRARDDDYAEF